MDFVSPCCPARHARRTLPHHPARAGRRLRGADHRAGEGQHLHRPAAACGPAHRGAAHLGQAFPGRVAHLHAARALSAVWQLPHQRTQGRAHAARPAVRTGRTQFLHLFRQVHRRAAGRRVRLAGRRDVGCLEPGARPGAPAGPARHAGVRRAARSGHFCGGGKHHQERGAVPHPRASPVHVGRAASRRPHRSGGAGPAIQL